MEQGRLITECCTSYSGRVRVALALARSSILGIVIVLLCGSSVAQIFPEAISKPVPVPPPAQLLQQLLPFNDQCCESKSEERRAGALKALGIPVEGEAEARLLFEDLDGDGDAEALFTVNLDLSDVLLIVLKRKGNQWYRLPSPPEFSCWCKYETSPLDTFVEIRHWSFEFEKPPQPRRLILVRGSSGGTGLYERGVEAFALRGFELRSVFATTEERSECSWPEGNCDLEHAIVLSEDENGSHALVVREVRRKLNAEQSFSKESWWTGLPVSDCKAYTWDAKQYKFAASIKATSAYCGGERQAPSKPSRK